MTEAPKIEDPDASLLQGPEGTKSSKPWLSWLIGAAACTALILVVTHLSEEEEFLLLLRRIDLYWRA